MADDKKVNFEISEKTPPSEVEKKRQEMFETLRKQKEEDDKKYVSLTNIMNGDVKGIEEDFKNNKQVREGDMDVLCNSISETNVKSLRYLLSRNILPKHPDGVCKRNDVELIQEMVERGCEFGKDAMEYAFYFGFNGIARFLFERFKLKPYKGMLYACKNGNVDLVRYALEVMKVKPEVYDINEACGNGSLDVVAYLFEKGFKANSFGANYACGNGKYEVVKFLSDRGILPNRYGKQMAEKKHFGNILSLLSRLELPEY